MLASVLDIAIFIEMEANILSHKLKSCCTFRQCDAALLAAASPLPTTSQERDDILLLIIAEARTAGAR